MLRETVSGIMEVYLSSLDMRMNSIMKVLTIISTIFIPLTFLTGLYGMNFIHIPFSTLHWGFYAILAGCVIVVIIMMVVAVLLTHMLSSAVASMKPATCRRGW